MFITAGILLFVDDFMGDINLTTKLQPGKPFNAEQVNNLVSTATVKTLPISRIDALQAVLDGKTDKGHTHGVNDVTGLQSALDSKAALAHRHEMENINGLGERFSSHIHEMASVNGLQEALNVKVNASVVEELMGSKAHKIHTHEIVLSRHLDTAYSIPQYGQCAHISH